MNAIEVNNLTKIYRLYNKPKDRLREIVAFSRKKFHHAFYALKDVTFNIEKGQTVGIIGQNGSGKSTLLKIICGIVQPTSGSVKVNGRVSSLLELGTGFHPEFTGRENVYMSGALMGFSREEMDQRFLEIEAFADIGEYIDQPVKTYSSGMFVRLAFASAINVDPDILVVDEALAVGDENFQSKCLRKVQELRRNGKTILLVSHNLSTIEHICNKVCLLDHGKCILEGEPTDIISAYHSLIYGVNVLDQMTLERLDDILPTVHKGMQKRIQQTFKRWGTKEVEITQVIFINKDKGQVLNGVFKTNEKLVAQIEFITHERVIRPVFGIAIHREDGTQINGPNTRTCNFDIPAIEGKGIIEYTVEVLPLLPGRYFFTVAIYDYDCIVPYDYWDKCLSFTIVHTESVKEQFGVLYLPGKWRLLN